MTQESGQKLPHYWLEFIVPKGALQVPEEDIEGFCDYGHTLMLRYQLDRQDVLTDAIVSVFRG